MAHNVICMTKREVNNIRRALYPIKEAAPILSKINREHINLTRNQMRILHQYAPEEWKSSFSLDNKQWDRSEDFSAEIFVI